MSKNLKKIVCLSLVFLISGFMFTPTIKANTDTKPNGVSVIGRGKIEANPDTAIINLGIWSIGKTAKEAQDENAKNTKNLFSVLEGLNINKEDIKTRWYTVYPEYNYKDYEDKIKKYRATHELTVEIKELDKVSEILSKITEIGNINISGVNYEIKDKDTLLNKARILAAEDAKNRANKLGDVFGFNVGKIISISENTSDGFYMDGYSKGGEADIMNNVIHPGKIEITLTLYATYEIKN